jgi:hypothetical protein
MSDYDYLDKGNVDGTIFGQSSSALIGFYGITATAQCSALTTALTTVTYTTATALATTIATAVTAGYGFLNTDEAQSFLLTVQNVQARLAIIQAALTNSGLVAGGTATSATDTKYDFVGVGNMDDGVRFGQDSSAKIGFWGITPCDQNTALTVTAATTLNATALASTTNYDYTIAALVSNSAGFGFTDAEEGATLVYVVTNLASRIAEAETALAGCGLIAGGTAIVSTTAKVYDYLDKGCTDGTIFGKASTNKLGFWGATPVDQPAAMTTALTTITCTAPGTTDYAIQSFLGTIATFKYVTATAAKTVAKCVINAQTRMAEVETVIKELGIVASA